VSIWEETSLVDLALPGGWAATWTRGEAAVLTVSPQGRLRVTDGRLALETSAGREFDPGRYLWLGVAGATPVFAEVGETPGQVGLREALVLVGAADVELAMRAAALAQYHTENQYCPGCGARTRPADLGRSRCCDGCGAVHFPRTDPAIIVAITDGRDRLLLGHHEGWEANRYSVFAGFAEAGESLEQTVRREVAEEVGLAVGDVQYVGSQPWPMPRSLMVGFMATAASESVHPDGEEITAARWFSREELRLAVDQGEVSLPLAASIAYRLVTRWYGEPLPE
jgi:NAD+ diphosphatase